MKIAVLGAGISGLGSAYLLSQKHEVDLFEKESRLGGHARTTMIKEFGQSFGVDTGFLVFNHETYPLLTRLFEKLNVGIEKSDMSFGFWDSMTNYAYNAQSLSGLFFQKKNLFSLSHYKMIRDILRFNKKANKDLVDDSADLDLKLGDYLEPFSDAFKQRYILPMGAAIWSTPSVDIHDFPTRTFLNFFRNHGLLGVTTQHQWLTVSGGSINYVEKIKPHISGAIYVNSSLVSVTRDLDGVTLTDAGGKQMRYDKVVFAMHAPDALALLGDASSKEKEILSSFAYKQNDAVLHNDTTALYPDKKIYAAWNYKSGKGKDVMLSYWLNKLQNLHSDKEYFVTLNESESINDPIERISYEHPQFNAKAIHAQSRRDEINGTNHSYFAGAYWRYGFHEDGLWSAHSIATTMGCDL